MSLFLVFLLSISLLGGKALAGKCHLYHRVKPGDSLREIADRYNIHIRDILRVNPGLRGKKYLGVGQRVCIPHERKVREQAVSKRSYFIYRVRPGDSPRKIAKKFGVSWKDIKRVNRLKSDIVREGQIIKVPVPKTASERRYLDKPEIKLSFLPVEGKREKVSRGLDIHTSNGEKVRAVDERRYLDKPEIKLSFLPVEGKYEEVSRGLDIYTSCGEKVRAVDGGRVIYSGDDLTSYGNMVIIEHTGYLSIYAYNMQNLVDMGDRVSKGEVIAKAGPKPGSGRCALHFEIRTKDGAVLNPLEYFVEK